jgi:glyoxylase-like metal-dependent hydrolase (beta-lactamase superfamily II)
MIKQLLMTGLAWLAVTGAANAQAPAAAPERSITQVAGDLYRFQNNEHYGMFMVTPQGVVLIDPLTQDAAEWIKGEIAARFNGAKVTEVLYSHYHWDHATGAAAFPGAKIVSRVETLKALQPPAGGDAKALENFKKQYANVLAPTETYNTPVKKITVGGKTVEMHYVPSEHTPDLSYLYFPAEKVLFVVDVVSLKRLPFRTMGDYEEKDAMASLDKAMSFDASKIVGGHGAIGNKQDVQALRQYYVDLQQGVKAGIDKGLTLDQIKTQLTLDKYAGWQNYGTQRMMNIEGMYAYLTKK